jgi:hypothetical protein
MNSNNPPLFPSRGNADLVLIMLDLLTAPSITNLPVLALGSPTKLLNQTFDPKFFSSLT